MSPFTKFIDIGVPASGNIRLNVIYDTINLNIEYKFEINDEVITKNVVFFGAVQFSFKNEKHLKFEEILETDRIFEKDTGRDRHGVSLKQFKCNFSDHGLLEVYATSFQIIDGGNPTMADLFTKFIGPDF